MDLDAIVMKCVFGLFALAMIILLVAAFIDSNDTKVYQEIRGQKVPCHKVDNDTWQCR